MRRAEFNALEPSCMACRHHSTHRLADVFPVDHRCSHPALLQRYGGVHKVDCQAMRGAEWRNYCGVAGRYFEIREQGEPAVDRSASMMGLPSTPDERNA